MPASRDGMIIANFIVQLAVLVALVFYALDTRKIRVASQQQVKASQEQAEAVQKPFVTLVTHDRRENDAVLDMNEAVGTRIVGMIAGNIGLRNEGSGPAINISYSFEPSFPDPPANIPRPSSYVPSIPARESSSIPVARRTIQSLDYRVTINYESLSGK